MQVFPVHKVSFHRTKRHAALPRLVAVDKRAPSIVVRCVKKREIGSSASDVGHRNIPKERRQTVAAMVSFGVRRIGEPVRMEMIPLAFTVLDQLKWLQVIIGYAVALEGDGALLDAANHVVSPEAGALGCAYAVCGFAARRIDDARVCEGATTNDP